MKRVFREISDDTKRKISISSKGKPKSYNHKLHISQSMRNYWAQIPSRENTGEVTTYQGDENGKNNAENHDK